MAYRFNFFARPVETNYQLDWESLVIESSLCIICAVMAFYGWQNGMLVVAYPTGIVAVMCLGIVIYTLFSHFRSKPTDSEKRHNT